MASNIGYLSLLRLAFTYQPCYTGQQQISMILYGCPYEEKGFKNAQRLELYQAMPWYTRNHPFQTIVESVSRLELDQLSLLLTMVNVHDGKTCQIFTFSSLTRRQNSSTF